MYREPLLIEKRCNSLCNNATMQDKANVVRTVAQLGLY